MKKNIAILVFDEVEVLDFAGPFEVFSVANELSGYTQFNVFIVAVAPGTVRVRNGLKIISDYTLENCPNADVLVIPGGAGTRPLLRQPSTLEWVRRNVSRSEVVLSVCTGSLLLAQAGLIDGQRVTTHHEMLDTLRQLAPAAIVDATRRFHDNGQIVSAAGISAGIDASLHVVSRLLGEAEAASTARYMEYGVYAQTP